MEKMAIKTAELAVVVQSAHQEQAKFESNQITIKERLFSNCTAQGAFNAAQGLAEVTAVAAGVRLAALAIPATIPTAGVLAIGLAASLLKQASNIAKDAEKK